MQRLVSSRLPRATCWSDCAILWRGFASYSGKKQNNGGGNNKKGYAPPKFASKPAQPTPHNPAVPQTPTPSSAATTATATASAAPAQPSPATPIIKSSPASTNSSSPSPSASRATGSAPIPKRRAMPAGAAAAYPLDGSVPLPSEALAAALALGYIPKSSAAANATSTASSSPSSPSTSTPPSTSTSSSSSVETPVILPPSRIPTTEREVWADVPKERDGRTAQSTLEAFIQSRLTAPIPEFAIQETRPTMGLDDPDFDYNLKTNPFKLAPQVKKAFMHLDVIASPDLAKLEKATSPYIAPEGDRIIQPEVDVFDALPPLEVIGAIACKEMELICDAMDKHDRMVENLHKHAQIAETTANEKEKALLGTGTSTSTSTSTDLVHRQGGAGGASALEVAGNGGKPKLVLDKNAQMVMDLIFPTKKGPMKDNPLIPYPPDRPDLAIYTQTQFMITAVRAKIKAELEAAKKYPEFVRDYPEFTIPFLHTRRLRMLPPEKYLTEPRRKPTDAELLNSSEGKVGGLVSRRAFKIWVGMLGIGMVSYTGLTLFDFHMEMVHGLKPPTLF